VRALHHPPLANSDVAVNHVSDHVLRLHHRPLANSDVAVNNVSDHVSDHDPGAPPPFVQSDVVVKIDLCFSSVVTLVQWVAAPLLPTQDMWLFAQCVTLSVLPLLVLHLFAQCSQRSASQCVNKVADISAFLFYQASALLSAVAWLRAVRAFTSQGRVSRSLSCLRTLMMLVPSATLPPKANLLVHTLHVNGQPSHSHVHHRDAVPWPGTHTCTPVMLYRGQVRSSSRAIRQGKSVF
jgi:hypothetical protein